MEFKKYFYITKLNQFNYHKHGSMSNHLKKRKLSSGAATGFQPEGSWGARFFRNKTFSGIRNKSQEKSNKTQEKSYKTQGKSNKTQENRNKTQEKRNKSKKRNNF